MLDSPQSLFNLCL